MFRLISSDLDRQKSTRTLLAIVIGTLVSTKTNKETYVGYGVIRVPVEWYKKKKNLEEPLSRGTVGPKLRYKERLIQV